MEVALAMTIAAILMALALPSMRDLLDQSAIRSHRQMLVQDIRKVRFKAISRRRPAYLCALDRTRKCTMQALWNEGWLGFVDNNLNGIYDQGDEHVLQGHTHEYLGPAGRRAGYARLPVGPGNSIRFPSCRRVSSRIRGDTFMPPQQRISGIPRAVVPPVRAVLGHPGGASPCRH